MSVDDFGADPSGRIDSAPAVTAVLRHAKTLDEPVEIVFSPGTYHLYPEHAETRELYVSNTVGDDPRYRDKRIGMLVEDMRDVTVDGGGARLIYHGLQTAFAAIRSSNVTFTNFSFDYAAPKVVDVTVASAGPGWRVLTIPAGSPYRIDDGHVVWLGEGYWSGVDGLQYTQIHDPAAVRTVRGDNPLFTGVATITDLGGQRIRIDYTDTTPPDDAGLVYQMRLTDRTEPGVFIWESTDVTLRALNACYLQSFGVVGQFSENITIDEVNFAPDPATGRTTSSFADHVQMSGVKGTVSITRCLFDGPHDDPINIHGTYLEVTDRLSADRLTLAYRHPETAGFPAFYPGDEVAFVDQRTMVPHAGGPWFVTAVDGPRPLTTMAVTFDRPVPAGVTVVENLTWTPSVVIADCVFRNGPTRGILVTTPKPVVITGNRFDGLSMASVFISADASEWYESGSVTDVTIRGNTFTRSTGPVILVDPATRVVDESRPVHRGITIEDNTFDVGDVTLLDAKSVRGLRFAGNVVHAPDEREQPQMVFRGCSGIVVE